MHEAGHDLPSDLDAFQARLLEHRVHRVVAFRYVQLAVALHDEQLVGAGRGMLSRDVDDDARQAVLAARIFAL